MKIFGKSRFDQNIYDKIIKGADAIELHLDDEFVMNPETWNEQYVKDVPIYAVHVPFAKDNDLYIEELSSHQVLIWTCDFANRIALEQGHKVIVVMHFGTSPWQLQRLGVYNDLIEFMHSLIESHPKIEIAIENVTRFNTTRPRILMFDHVDFHAAPQFAREINHPRIGTCLDVCHAMVDTALIKEVSKHLNSEDYYINEEITVGVEAFFKENQDTIKLIHLSNCHTHGMNKDHGLPYCPEDKNKLTQILNFYKKYNYKCPITLEVKEKDYSDGLNFLATYTTLQSIL